MPVMTIYIFKPIHGFFSQTARTNEYKLYTKHAPFNDFFSVIAWPIEIQMHMNYSGGMRFFLCLNFEYRH